MVLGRGPEAGYIPSKYRNVDSAIQIYVERVASQFNYGGNVVSFGNRDIAYLIPLVSLFGSVILAFHAYYLIFSRHYSEFLEKKINKKLDKELIITHKLENSYFFPINDKKIVVAKIGKNFSWFSFVTLLITAYGIASYSYGVYVISYYLSNNVYLYLLALVTLVTIIIGYWWFVKNIGEERLSKSYEQQI